MKDNKEATFRAERVQFWDQYWADHLRWAGIRKYYGQCLENIFGFVVPPGSSVIEIGCGQGKLLSSVSPGKGVGVDFSEAAIAEARKRYPQFEFHVLDAHGLDLGQEFDFVILSDLVNDLWDVQKVLEIVGRHCHRRTRVLINFHSNLWQPIRALAEWLGLVKPQLRQNWITPEDLTNLLYLSGFEPIRYSREVLCPIGIPLLGDLLNRYFARLWPFSLFAVTNFLIARKQQESVPAEQTRVTVVVAARNEEGNIAEIFARVPQMGSGTELIFVEGGSKDNTYRAIEEEIPKHPDMDVRLYRQTGKGKGDAVRLGFAKATGDVLMILDADLTVPPEDLPRFFEAWRVGKGDFINGVRLVYPMEEKAMRFFNLIGNKFFANAFSWLLNQPIKDSLCGTKVLSRRDYEMIAANRAYFGDFDPYGDFDLIFGAARFNLKMVDLPVRYRERVYGETNISRWSGGVILLRMVIHAMRRIKFT